MALPRRALLVAGLLAAALPLLLLRPAEAGTVGVNYGRVANNLPNPAAVVQLLKQQGITQVKLYDADPTVLRALANTGIKVVVALPNEQLAAAASRASYALLWVRRNVAAYYPATQIQGIAVGNEVFATAKNVTAQLVPAMVNVHAALARLNLDKSVKVSSPIALVALATSYPSSAGAFREDLAQPVMKPMLDFLAQTGSYLMVNAYPFFAYSGNARDISLDYALFRPNDGVLDTGNGLKYYSLLDAQLDAVFAAVSRLGNYNGVRVVVSETGWPSKGDANEVGASAANAAAYNGNLARRVLSGNAGTPLRPDADIDVYLFALFNENQKPGPTSERNYGVFYPNQQKVYDVEFVLGGGGAAGGGSQGGGGGLGWQENGGPTSGNPPSGVKVTTGEAWCVANAMVGEQRLQAALNYACGEGGADCKAIQPGAACFEPNTMVAHASYAFNDYYQRKGRSIGTCDFAGAAYVVNQAPKVGKCDLPSTV
ncbi:glucan endo-1,3-beta-glucosidase 10-like isoform X2 [Panicum virgatum]|uniref:glucan endo-1,3-beta-glucosidase 10-like isoform X2 n=1 Tax=Panicum virgatum TaxID=38727 RepID=UPI0019D58545|nr:glucan endo-1,3-beta-glucosidase 10-like isoform X2 [Panicum virgatum]